MSRTHFTEIVVSRLKTPGTYYDHTTPAFGLRVGKNRKTWFVIRGRERLRTNVGRYPEVGLSEARKHAKKLLTETPTRGDRMTVQDAHDLYLVALETKKPRTQRDYKRMLGKYLLPALAKKKLGEVTYDDVTKTTSGLKPSEAAHALATARTFFRWCVRPPRRYIPHSPLEGLKIAMGKPRKRVLKDTELVRVWKAAVDQGYPHGMVVQLLILTGQRRGEIASLRWPWINEREQTITLPPEITKNGLEHTFPFNGRVAQILETVPRLNSTDLLFPSRVSEKRPISGWSKFKKEMEDHVDGWTLHDLRRTFATGLAQINVPPHIVERLLNHKMGSIGNKADGLVSAVAQIYNLATYLPEMRVAIERWDTKLSDVLAK